VGEWSTVRIVATTRDTGRTVVVFRHAGTTDPRDLVDQDVDLVVTDDPMVVEYASARPKFIDVPFPWSRTYVLVGSGLVRDSARADIARDLVRAVHADARVPEPPFWWDHGSLCPERGTSPTSGNGSRRIMYSAEDRVAADLAGRLVALSSDRR